MLMSPSMARLADTPPVVGSVITEMNGNRASDKRFSAALVFAICSSEYKRSCMRAPPLAEKHTSGMRCSRQCSTARTNFSPTTEPIEPPRKRNSKAHGDQSRPASLPRMTISASRSPVCFCACSERSL
jgi:hypothetical protein